MSESTENHDKAFKKLLNELQDLKLAYTSLQKSIDDGTLKNPPAGNTLHENDDRFWDLFQNAPINYQILNNEICFVDVNPAWLSTLGYNRDEVIGYPFSKFLTPLSDELIKKCFSDFKKSDEIHELELEMICKDRKQIFVNFKGKPSLDEKGNIQQIHCIWTDITLRKQTEEVIRVKDWAIESSTNAMAICDMQGKLTYVNPASIKLWEYNSATELLGKSVTDFWLNPEQASEVIKAVGQNGSWSGEMAALKKNGKSFDVQASASMVKDSSGKPVCMLASFADLSQIKQAWATHSAIEVSYQELFNNVADAIYILDEDSSFINVNEGAAKMYGYPREILIGKNLLFVSAPGKNNLQAINELVKLAHAGKPQQFEFWGLRSNGEIFPKEVRIFSGTYFGKKVNIAMAQDITDRKNIAEALQKSERRFRELIELAVDGILVGSPEGIIVEANSYMQKLTGRPLKKLIGFNITDLFELGLLKEKPLRYDLLKKGKTVINERNIVRTDGTTVPVEMHTKMMPDGMYQSIYRDITERKKSEETLRQSEEKFKSLVESTTDIIWETNKEGFYTYVSPQIEAILGYTPAEVIGNSPYDYIADDILTEIKAEIQSPDQSTTPFYLLVNKYKHKNGQPVYFETSGMPIYDSEEKLSGYRGMSRDISKRFHAEQELHKLSAVVQQSPNTLIITDLDGKIEYINPTGCAVSGYTIEELVGRNASVFSSGKTSEKEYKSLWNTIKKGEKWKGILYNKKKNGECFYESVSILPIKNANGTATHYLAIKEDISDRLQSETALKESEERYRELFEASPDAIILADIETEMLIDANTAACKMLGRTLDEIKTMHQAMIHPPRKSEYSKAAFRQDSEKGQHAENLQPIENFILRSDGSEIPVEILADAIMLNGRRILQGVFRNITERKLARAELLRAKESAEASDKLKSAFLQNITHELRTPLNGIIGFSEMITRMDSSEADRLEYNRLIRKSSSRLINTVTNYMDISMIVSGSIATSKQPFNLRSFLNKVIDHTIETCNSQNLNLDVIKKTEDDNFRIDSDEVMLTKIFSHLIDNAIKFTRKGSITIAYKYKNNTHLFSVSDTGTGISEESLPVIFEIFRQADASASREYEGSGLGLSIAKGFVKRLGGDIWVESTNTEGSTFCFTIPENDSSAKVDIPLEKPTKSKQPVVLVAEDDDSNYKYLEIVLRKADFKVLRSYNGFETIEICRNSPEICILLTDMKMPDMDGFESTRQIRKMLPQLPIIALSGLISSEDENAARLVGCNDYIVKPISKSRLLGAINKLLQKTNI